MRKNVDSRIRSLRLLPIVLAVVAVMACGKSNNQTGSASRSEPLAVYCKKFVSESVEFSAGLRERKSLVDQCIEF